MSNAIKRPQLSDGTGVDLRSLIRFVEQAESDLRSSGYDDSADYFELIHDFLQQDVANGKPFVYRSRILGL